MKLLKKFSPKYKETILSSDSSIKDALTLLSKSGLMIVCVVHNKSKNLLGIITDSDIRRALLNGATLENPVESWINTNPVTAHVSLSAEELTSISRNVGKREIPLLNDQNEVDDIFVLGFSNIRISEDLLEEHNEAFNKTNTKPSINNYFFILAGGLGSRLKSVVNDRPKPLALIGGKPIIDILITQAAEQGFKNYYISTNYLAEQIEAYLGQEKFSSLNIKFIREDKKLGTAGSIGLINHKVNKSILVCNADILTKVHYNKIIEHHENSDADITCVVRPFQLVVPYGVVQINNNLINSVIEKPKYDFLVNAGIYVLSPNICKLIKKNEYLDMPNFIKQCLNDGKSVQPYLLHEYWVDVGQPEDYQRANSEFHLYFGS